MGFLNERHGINLMGLEPIVGRCNKCGFVHAKDKPHNLGSVVFLLGFYDKEGRWPSWMDAMEDMTDEQKTPVIEQINEMGGGLDDPADSLQSLLDNTPPGATFRFERME